MTDQFRLHGDTSRSFPTPESGPMAVKGVSHFADQVTNVLPVTP